mmetsp:Transcript_23147/g.87611  ORF Transcript_23147/g.87611 Transcript_23147/m.87611 type:complete len:204 (+) Transcript_23147:1884-2495(+)
MAAAAPTDVGGERAEAGVRADDFVRDVRRTREPPAHGESGGGERLSRLAQGRERGDGGRDRAGGQGGAHAQAARGHRHLDQQQVRGAVPVRAPGRGLHHPASILGVPCRRNGKLAAALLCLQTLQHRRRDEVDSSPAVLALPFEADQVELDLVTPLESVCRPIPHSPKHVEKLLDAMFANVLAVLEALVPGQRRARLEEAHRL